MTPIVSAKERRVILKYSITVKLFSSIAKIIEILQTSSLYLNSLCDPFYNKLKQCAMIECSIIVIRSKSDGRKWISPPFHLERKL